MPRSLHSLTAGPTVWFAGDVREPSFAPLVGALAARARLQFWPNARSMAQATESAAADRPLIVVGTSRGGPLDLVSLEQLRDRRATRGVVLLAGPWSAGVLAKQKLPAGIDRMEWYERERLWSLIDQMRTRQPLLAFSHLMLLADFNFAEADVLLDLCAARGLHAFRSPDVRTRTTEVRAVLWRATAWNSSSETRLLTLRARHPAAALLALVESLRPGEERALVACGCDSALSWPCELAAIEQTLDAVLAGAAPASPARAQAAFAA